MKEYKVETHYDSSVIGTDHRTYGEAKTQFDTAVRCARLHRHVTSVLLLRRDFGGMYFTIRSWCPSFEDTSRDALAGYVVHSVRSCDGNNKSSSWRFYKTYGQAETVAKKCVKSWRSDHEGAIIFKAIKHVHAEQPRVQIDDIE
jgi:hypothetical protein